VLCDLYVYNGTIPTNGATVVDKDEVYLDDLAEKVHLDWANGRMTNYLRSDLLMAIEAIKDEL
jgi:hypothetical protein